MICVDATSATDIARMMAYLSRPPLQVVAASCYGGITATDLNYSGGENGETHRSINHLSRIAQTGIIRGIQFYFGDVSTYTQFIFRVYRKTGTDEYTEIYSYDITGLITQSNAVNTIPLPSIVEAHIGDYVGFTLTDDGTPHIVLSNGWWQCICKMEPPIIAAIGDSLTVGANGTRSLCEDRTEIFDETYPYIAQLSAALHNIPYTNLGIGAQTTTQIENRFQNDVISRKPKIVVIQGGTNDPNNNLTKEQYITNITGMVNTAITEGIIPIVLSLSPVTGWTDDRCRMLDEWKFGLLRSLPPSAIYVDLFKLLGVTRLSGSPGNLWDLNPAITTDGVHPNRSGYYLIARAIKMALMGA